MKYHRNHYTERVFLLLIWFNFLGRTLRLCLFSLENIYITDSSVNKIWARIMSSFLVLSAKTSPCNRLQNETVSFTFLWLVIALLSTVCSATTFYAFYVALNRSTVYFALIFQGSIYHVGESSCSHYEFILSHPAYSFLHVLIQNTRPSNSRIVLNVSFTSICQKV